MFIVETESEQGSSIGEKAAVASDTAPTATESVKVQQPIDSWTQYIPGAFAVRLGEDEPSCQREVVPVPREGAINTIGEH